jgi:hypothetical protein
MCGDARLAGHPGVREARGGHVEDGPIPYFDVLRVAISDAEGRELVVERADVYELHELSFAWERDRLWVYWADDLERRVMWFERREDEWAWHAWHVPYRFTDDLVVASYCDVGLEGRATLPPPPEEVLPSGLRKRFRREAEARGWTCDRQRP